MRRRPLLLISCVIAILAHGANQAIGECAPFHNSLDDAAAVQSGAGTTTGMLSFVPGINAASASFSGGAYVTWNDDLFNSPSGSASFWIRKNSADVSGGILQIGTLGQPNSIGVFYNNQDTIYFERRNNASQAALIAEPGALSQSDWRHVVVSWSERVSGSDMWLFIDGRFQSHTFLAGSFVHSAGSMQLGTTGFYGNGECLIDELRVFDWNLGDDEVYAEYVSSAERFQRQPTAKPVSTGPVQIVGKHLLLNGEPFTVRGVGYQPTPIGTPISGAAIASMYTDPGIIARDMALLRAMNVNTIRLWSQVPDATLLDACYNGGENPIYVIMGFWVPQHAGVDYADAATAAAIRSDFRTYVSQFKNHPAVLAWGIGNENNLAYQGDLSDWYALANDLALEAWLEEGATYHPAVVNNGGLRHFGDVSLGSDDASLDLVDVWGHNAYPGSDFHCYFDYFDRMSSKPLLFMEFGIDAWDNAAGNEYEQTQAAYVVQQWRQLVAASVGGTLMAYSDEWWKAGDPMSQDSGGYGTPAHPDGFSNEEWWGVMRAVDNGPGIDVLQPRQVYFDLGFEFTIGLGDLNCDGAVDAVDIPAFVLAVTDSGRYASSFPSCNRIWADCDADGVADELDVSCFVAALLND